MGTSEIPTFDAKIVSTRIRGLAIATGVLVAITGSLSQGVFFAIMPSLLVLGAVIQLRSAPLGRVLMWIGALYVTLFAAPFLGLGALETIRLLNRFHDFNTLLVLFLSALSFLLVCLCDVALIIDAIIWGRCPSPKSHP